MSQNGFHVDRQVSLSFFVELVLLASLIVGSWVNLQRQLDGLQKDVTVLLEKQGQFVSKVEVMQEKAIAMDYRVKALENR